ncbi:probable G-protein coupled receptor 148 [Narcine bancroftii]|uniref:probable G-protein coupled receptor 148 n=1 Tax=Narcine bancroftii TaxID=1343680 RepID=UPI0038318585
MNATGNCSASAERLVQVRVFASLASFVLLAASNVLIGSAILRAERLRSQARFVLLLHLLLSGLLYFGLSSAFYLLARLDAAVAAAWCLALLLALMVSGSAILLTLTLMALDRYLAICHPLRYRAGCGPRCAWGLWPLIWLLASVLPLLLVLDQPQAGRPRRCALRSGHPGKQACKMVLVGACTLLILFSYLKVLAESRRLGALNRRARRTILMHGAQLGVYILPAFVTFSLQLLARAGRLHPCAQVRCEGLSFAFFSLAQCLSPAIYGLRKDELWELLVARRFRRDLKGALRGLPRRVDWRLPGKGGRAASKRAGTPPVNAPARVLPAEDNPRLGGSGEPEDCWAHSV